MAPDQLHDDALGRAFDTLYAYGVTARYSLLAATAAAHLGLMPRLAHRERPSVPVDGRDTSDAAPVDQVVPITRGYSREHRPALNPVMLELMVEPQAGLPRLLNPRRGNSRDAHDVGDVVGAHVPQLHTTYGTTSLVADRALYRADNLQKLAQTRMRGITRVPATWSEAQAALAQGDPHALASLTEGSRSGALRSTYGGIAPRWRLSYSESRPPHAQRPIDTPWGQHSATEVKAFRTVGGTTGACAAEAGQALSLFAQALQATGLGTSTVRALPRDGTRGRPGRGVQPGQVVYQLEGGLASSLTARHARIDQHRCVILATNELDGQQLSPPELRDGAKGQSHAERGFRFLQDPQFFASSL